MTKSYHELRLDVCNVCPFNVGGECALCGCTISEKVLKEEESCPMVPPKWIAVTNNVTASHQGSSHPNTGCKVCTKRK